MLSSTAALSGLKTTSTPPAYEFLLTTSEIVLTIATLKQQGLEKVLKYKVFLTALSRLCMVIIKLPSLLTGLKDVLSTIDERQFSLVKESRINKLRSKQTQALGSQAYMFLNEFIRNSYVSADQELQKRSSIAFNNVKNIFQKSTILTFMEGFVFGKVVKNGVQKLVQTEAVLASNAESCPLPEDLQMEKTLMIERGKWYMYRRQMPHKNNAVLNYYDLLNQGFLKELRTNQQLGYLVRLNFIVVGTAVGLVTFIQGSSSPTLFDDRIEKFFKTSLKYFEMWTEESFEHQKQNLPTKILQEPKSFVNKNWELFSYKKGHFYTNGVLLFKFLSAQGDEYEEITSREELKQVSFSNLISNWKTTSLSLLWFSKPFP